MKVYRRLLAVAGFVYLAWWFAVELILPGEFNPLGSRLAVVAAILVALAISYRSRWVQAHIQKLFYAGCWLITLHYYYLMNGNAADINWVIGAYITVMAITLAFLSTMALLSYSVFVSLLSTALVVLHPQLAHSVFVPGLVTILLQANFGLRSRLILLQSLNESNERFQLLFNATFEGVMVHEQGRITNVNTSLAKMLGYEIDELTSGMKILDIVHPSQRALVADAMRIKELTAPIVFLGLRKDGSVLTLEARAKDFQLGRKLARIVTMQDISDRKRAESERIAALTLMENIRIRDEFISLASHELKTPISALKLQTQLMERELKGGTEYSPQKMTDVLGLYHRQVDRLTELVTTLLDVSQISAGRLVLEKSPVDLTALVREAVAALPKDGLTGKISIEASDNMIVEGDRSRLRQVIDNLLTNAVKYGDGKPVRVELRLVGPYVHLIVADHGIGIAADALERIFGRFERAISARNISGLGLGLYISRQIVEAHHGQISVDSKLGEGSTFTVSLPAKK